MANTFVYNSPDGIDTQATTASVTNDSLTNPDFKDSQSEVSEDESLTPLKKVFYDTEKRYGTALKCNDGIVEKVNCIAIAAFLAMALGFVYIPSEKTIWHKP